MERSEKIDRFLRKVIGMPSYDMVTENLKHNPYCSGVNLETSMLKRNEVLIIGDRFTTVHRVEIEEHYVECGDCYVKERYYL